MTILSGTPVTEGAGVKLRRLFGHNEAPMFDPFLLLDDFRSDTPADYIKGFPWHPHRGIETITYMLKGEAHHGDSLGNRGTIKKGEVQWMSAGSGIIHQEMPKGDETGAMHGFQLWMNLPTAHKMSEPTYRSIAEDEIPEIKTDTGARVKIIAGSMDGVSGPVSDVVTTPLYLDITVEQGAHFAFDLPPSHTTLIYAIHGEGMAAEQPLSNGQLLKLDEGAECAVTPQAALFRCLLFSAQPLGEPVAWRGPIVMNTQEELQIAFDEYRNGNFIKS